MSMTLKKAAIKSCEDRIRHLENAPIHHYGKRQRERAVELEQVKIAALRPVSREQVERMRGEWMFKPFYKGTSRGAIECQECKGAFEGSVAFNFCPNCGAPMTDEAVQMVMERLEALHDTGD